MQILPILKALRSHRIAASLITLEIALAFAVFCNACFLIMQRVDEINVISGVDEHALASFKIEGFDPRQANDLNARIMEGLQGIAGVKSVSVISSVPFGEAEVIAGVHLDESQKHFGGVVDFYVAGPGAAEAMGLNLVSGRMPTMDEYTPIAQIVPNDAPVLLPRALATHFWPDQNPIGKTIWGMGTRFRVIGILDHLAVPQPGAGEAEDSDWSIFVPALPGPQLAGKYLLRATPEEISQVMRDAKSKIKKIAPDVVLDEDQSKSVDELREKFFLNSRVMVGLLLGIVVALLSTTALGIIGLASFWVTQRRKQIGIRRALGARRADILRYFQTENLLIVTIGIAAGMILAVAINLMLMKLYELPRLPMSYFPFGSLALWITGQIAVLAPALRAAALTPVEAIRS